MVYDFKKLKADMVEAKKWLEGEYFGIRTGRATPALLDVVQVEAYGARLPINQVASLGVEDARTIRITPYDMSQGKEIEKAITVSNLGVSVNTDDKGLRVTFPDLTSERREQLLKVVSQRLEEARVTIRTSRDEVWDDIQSKAQTKEVSEDEKFRFKEEMQKIVDDANRQIDAVAEKKRAELSS